MFECQLTFDWLFLISIMLDHYNNCTSLHIRYTTFSLFLSISNWLVLYSEVICLNYEQDFKTLFYSRYNKLSHENTIRWWLSKCARSHIIKCSSCEYTCTIYNIIWKYNEENINDIIVSQDLSEKWIAI
jgi:hypothetical protein